MQGPDFTQSATMEIKVLADDPTFQIAGLPVLTNVRVPMEALEPGPRGARFEVIDYDASSGKFYKAATVPLKPGDETFSDANAILHNPEFHAQHVYGVAAATLFEFERALGRSLSWAFPGQSHQLKLVPHAFEEANAFYSRASEALLFGYFRPSGRRKAPVYTCLSHDIVAHETAHALLDGLRDQYMRPSSPQQAAFHEAFADIVALFSVLRSETLIQFALQRTRGDRKALARGAHDRIPVVATLDAISDRSALLGLAGEFGSALDPLGRGALRRSIAIDPDPKNFGRLTEEHALGEVLVAAMLNAFLAIWRARLTGKLRAASWQSAIGPEDASKVAADSGAMKVDAWRVAEEGAKAAQHMLTIAIRAIDYMPPVHIEFADFLKALVTADFRVSPDDSTYGYRAIILAEFQRFGILPSGSDRRKPVVAGGYAMEDSGAFHYGRGNTDSMRFDREGMFRFIWQNRNALGLSDGAYTRVNSVRSACRVSPEGVILRETVAEYYQLIDKATAADLERLDVKIPPHLPRDTEFELIGGGTLIFDEFGRLLFHIVNHLDSKNQKQRLTALRRSGQLIRTRNDNAFAFAHLRRSGVDLAGPREV